MLLPLPGDQAVGAGPIDLGLILVAYGDEQDLASVLLGGTGGGGPIAP